MAVDAEDPPPSLGSTDATAASPLLVLLDGVLSRDEERVAQAVREIQRLVPLSASSVFFSSSTEEQAAADGWGVEEEPTGATTPTPPTTGSRNHPPHPQQQQSTTTLPTVPPLWRRGQTPITSSALLCRIVAALLQPPPNDTITNDTPSTTDPTCSTASAALSSVSSYASVRSHHDGSLPLHFAASLGNVPLAKIVLEAYPAAASTPNQKGKIPLHYAAREGRSLAMVQYFLRAAPETVRIATTKGKLAVHFAAGDGHAAIASELLRYYPESAVVATSSKGKLPLHFCARWGYLDIAYELLHVHPEAVRAMDWEGSLPLHDAAREGQYQMSRYLIERFPQALQTANLRGEIPLFSAVRSANIKLALLMIQAWPLGGRHILRHNASVFDDHVSGWNADILELLLRGAVDNLRDETECPLLRGHEPPTVRLMNPTTATSVAIGNTWVNGDFAPHKPTDTMKRFKKACGLNSAAALKLVGQCSASAVSTKYPPYHHEQQQQQKERNDDKDEPQQNAAFFLGQCDSVSSPKATNAATMALMRSKSPILSMEHEVHETAIDSKAPDMKREARKRSRRNQRHSLDEEGLLVERKFIHLHAAFESKVSSHVIQHILQAHAEDRTKVDERGRLALHWAVTHCQEDHDDIVNLIITSNLITQSAASTPDSSGKYPLHLAIESRADVRIISALLLAYPVVGVDPCRTTDSLFSDATPVQMATHCGCDLSTVFLLLRVDPSFVTRMVHDFR